MLRAAISVGPFLQQLLLDDLPTKHPREVVHHRGAQRGRAAAGRRVGVGTEGVHPGARGFAEVDTRQGVPRCRGLHSFTFQLTQETTLHTLDTH